MPTSRSIRRSRPGGRAYRFFLPVLRAQAQARRSLDLELRRAYSENEFELYFQPQVRLADGAVVGAEALMRWRHPVAGILAPGTFIDTLGRERDRARGEPLDHPHRLLEDRRHGAPQGLPLGRIAVNLFPTQLGDEALLHDLDEALRDTGLPAEALELEITENVALDFERRGRAAEDPRPRHQARVRRFRHRLCLAELPDALPAVADQDRPQLHRQDHRRRRRRRDRALADRDGAQSRPAKWSRRAWRRLPRRRSCSNQKCEEAQGYLYAKPLPAAEFEAYLRHHPLADATGQPDRRISREATFEHRAAKSAVRRAPRG